MKRKDKSTSYHEAAHCFCYFINNEQIKYVSIKPDPERNSLGTTCTKSQWPLQNLGREYIREYIIVNMAGGIAEQILCHKKIRTGNIDYWKTIIPGDLLQPNSDMGRLQNLWSSTTELLTNLNKYSPVVVKRLKENWSAIKALAKELQKEEILYCSKIESILKKYIKKPS